MSKYRFFHVDAFANKSFEGNQAAVMPMDAYLDDAILQAIAAENNFAETAFIVQTGPDTWDLRWFTPTIEVPLCGHATLASAHVIFNDLGYQGDILHFDTRKSGRLSVTRLDDGQLEMDFPADAPKQTDIPAGLAEALGAKPKELWAGAFLLAVFDTPEEILALSPDHAAIEPIAGEATGGRGNVICSAPGSDGRDVVSRFFAPGSGIPEDAATGSAHCIIAPLFSEKLGKEELSCFQAFPSRGAYIGTKMCGDRVKLRGNSVTVVEGWFNL